MSKTILGALVASVLLVLPLAGCADSGHEHGDGDESESASEGGHDGDHGGATPQPASLESAWTALMAVRDAIAADVESGALGDVHEKAESLPKLVAALIDEGVITLPPMPRSPETR